MIVAIVSTKGGVGKTTLAVGLATLWLRAERRVLGVDADPNGHLSEWLGRIGSTGCVGVDEESITRTVRREAATHDVLVIDVAGAASMALAKAAALADLMVIPSRSGDGDTREAARTFATIRDLRAPSDARPVAAVLTQVDTRTAIARHARAQLVADGLPVLAATLAHRVAYPEAWTAGVSPLDASPAAAAELQAIAAELQALCPA